MTSVLGGSAAIAAVGLAALVGVLSTRVLLPTLPRFDQAVLGLLAGAALLLVGSYAGALLGTLPLVWGLLAVTGLVAWLRSRRAPAPPSPSPARAEPLDGVLLVTLAAAFAWFAAPLLRRSFPLGWDPAFHVSIVESIRALGRLPETWAPYEPGERFNYPAGLHCAMSALASAGGLRSEQVFTFTFLGAGALVLLAVAALARRFGGTLAALLAVALYGFTDGWGTLASHVAWGGISNLVGLALMSGFFLLVAEPSRRSVALAALLAAAIAFTHHLSFFLLGFCVLWLVALEGATERRVSPVGRAALAALVLATATAGVVVLARPSGRFELLQAFRFEREAMLTLGAVWERMGGLLLVPGVAGLALALREFRSPQARLLPAWTIGLLGFWALWDLVYRAGVYWLTGENYTAFTPSRGLTDAAVPLAICGGWILARAASWLPRGRSVAGLVLVVGVVGLGARGERARLEANPQREAGFAQAREACELVRRRTPEDAVIFAPNAGEVGIWLPFLCGREFNYFPDPGYADSRYRTAKMRANDPASFASVVRSHGGNPVFSLTRGRHSGRRVGEAGGWALYEVEP